MTEKSVTPAMPKRRPGRPPKHGAFSGVELIPVTSEKRQEIMEVLHGTALAVAPSDSIYVDLLARNLAKIELMDRWLTINGLICTDKDGNQVPQPILKVYWVAVNAAMRACDQLGLTPTSRTKLGGEMLRTERDIAADMASRRDDYG